MSERLEPRRPTSAPPAVPGGAGRAPGVSSEGRRLSGPFGQRTSGVTVAAAGAAGAAGTGGTARAGGEGEPLSLSAVAGEPTDEELVRRMREGEAAAGEMLCRRYFSPLMRYLQRLTRSGSAAEELFQQTWLSVMEHLDRFDPAAGSGGFKSWLFRIATNKATDHWRGRGRRARWLDDRDATVLAVARDDTSMSRVETQEAVERLRAAIEHLPEGQRQVLLLRYYTGMKFIDIARTLGCPLNTALGRMHKAVLKLRAALTTSDAAQPRPGAR
ncbi:MAG: RNA polymerase sigma factor [Tepidisphaerales bacterium]